MLNAIIGFLTKGIRCRVHSNEFRRWLAKQGATFQQGKGSHIKVFLNKRQSVLPMHSTELKTGTVEGIKKQLGLKGK